MGEQRLWNHTSTPNMTGRRFHRTTEALPRRPWKAKRFFASRPIKISIKKGTRGVRTRYDTVLFPFISIVPRSSSHVGPRICLLIWLRTRARLRGALSSFKHLLGRPTVLIQKQTTIHDSYNPPPPPEDPHPQILAVRSSPHKPEE